MLNMQQKAMLKIFIICALFFIQDGMAACEAENQYPWSYHGTTNNPPKWADSYPGCGEKDQAPVEIEDYDTLSLQYPDLTFENFDQPVTQATVKNVGWTVMITPEDDVVRSVPWRGATFVLDEIHIHFGGITTPGAEHIINNLRSEAEMHFVTHKDDDESKIVVVALILDAWEENNEGLKPVVDVLPDIMNRDDSTKLQSDLDLSKIFSDSSSPYYYYDGRSSVPPCESGYFWLVLKNNGEIGDDQLDKFNALYSVGKGDESDDCKMTQNYRPEQPLRGRKVFSSN